MKKDKWIKRWDVVGSNDNAWRVAVDKNGNYGCSCPRWKFKREQCKHIQYIKKTKPTPNKTIEINKPEIRFYNIDHPIFDKEANVIKCPLVRIEPYDLGLEVEIDVMMMNCGYGFQEVKDIRHLPGSWTKRAVYYHFRKYIGNISAREK